MNKNKKEELKKEILQHIGYAILNKKQIEWQSKNGKIGISYDEFTKLKYEVKELLDKIKITDICLKKKFFSKNITVTVVAKRLGIFIGKKGELFNHILKFLNTYSKYKCNIKLKESKIDDYLLMWYDEY